jgi:DNA polymerase III sliding clamp (beta) subunit (PCNA family)
MKIDLKKLPDPEQNRATKDIAKIVRTQLKKYWPTCKFSVTRDYNSMHIALMQSDFNPYSDSFIDDKENYSVTKSLIDYDGNLSSKGKELFKFIVKLTDYYNWDRSDTMTDYSDVNFYLTTTIGKWDKPYKQVKAVQKSATQAKTQTDGDKPSLKIGDLTITDYSDKSILLQGTTKDQYERIMAIGGGKWNRFKVGWFFKIEKKQDVIDFAKSIAGVEDETKPESKKEVKPEPKVETKPKIEPIPEAPKLTKEPQKEDLTTTEQPIKEEQKEDGVYDWQSLPDVLKVYKPVKKIKINKVDPKDKGLISLFSPFVAKDELRPVIGGVYINGESIIATDLQMMINYPAKSDNTGLFKLKTGSEIKEKPLDYFRAVPTIENQKEVDVITLLTYAHAADSFANKYSGLIVTKKSGEAVGLNFKRLIDVLKAFLKTGYETVYMYQSYDMGAMVFSPVKFEEKHQLTKDDFFILLMPMRLASSHNYYGARDIDFNYRLTAYFDFDENKIISSGKEFSVNPKFKAETQGNISLDEMKILAVLMRQKNTIKILDYALVKNGILIKSDFEHFLVIKDCGLPDGLYRYDNALLLHKDPNLDISDYPELPTEFERIGKTSGEELKDNLNIAFKFVADDELRPVMNGVLFDFDNNPKEDDVKIVSSDSHALYIDISEIDSENILDFILSGDRFVQEAIKLFGQNVEIFAKKQGNNIENVKFIWGNVELITRPVEGFYPSYYSVIPSENKHSIQFDTKEILKHLPTKKKDLEKISLGFKLVGDSVNVTYRKEENKNIEVLNQISVKTTKAPYYEQLGILLMPMFQNVEDYDTLLAAKKIKDIFESFGSKPVNMYWNDNSHAVFLNSEQQLIKSDRTDTDSTEPDIMSYQDYVEEAIADYGWRNKDAIKIKYTIHLVKNQYDTIPRYIEQYIPSINSNIMPIITKSKLLTDDQTRGLRYAKKQTGQLIKRALGDDISFPEVILQDYPGSVITPEIEVKPKAEPVTTVVEEQKTEDLSTKDAVKPSELKETDINKEYKNQYEQNKAIEALIDKKLAKQEEFTPEEKAFINTYSGYGGLQKYGASGKGIMTEYYTPDAVVEKMWQLAYKYGFEDGDSVLENSVGVGRFLKYVPQKSNVDAYEINRYSYLICKILYPAISIRNILFEQSFVDSSNKSLKSNIKEKYDLVIGNPPYGNFDSEYSHTEKKYTKATNLTEYFISRGLDVLKKNGLLIYIIGTSIENGGIPFLDSESKKVKESIANKAKLIDAYRLGNGVFAHTDVLADIVVFRKK